MNEVVGEAIDLVGGAFLYFGSYVKSKIACILEDTLLDECSAHLPTRLASKS
jgi:hypothetical protein